MHRSEPLAIQANSELAKPWGCMAICKGKDDLARSRERHTALNYANDTIIAWFLGGFLDYPPWESSTVGV